MNDLVVAALVTCAMFFALGRATGELALACLAVALLLGTKMTGVLALPVLLAVAALVHRGRQLALLLVAGLRAALAGAAWLTVNIAAGNGRSGRARRGIVAAAVTAVSAIAARLRAMRSRHSSFRERPGATAICISSPRPLVVIVGVVLRQASAWPSSGPSSRRCRSLVLPAERRAPQHLLARMGARRLRGGRRRSGRHATRLSRPRASRGTATVGLALTLVAARALSCISRRRGRRCRGSRWSSPRRRSSSSSERLSQSWYHDLSGRFVMGGVALSAATWGLVRPFRAASAAVVAVAATTVLLSLVNSAEKPLGIELLEPTGRPSTWRLPREWVQNTQPELARRDELRRRSCSRRGDDRP